MSARTVDLAVEARWMLTAREHDGLLEHHTLIVHEGRIGEILPTPLARSRYAPLATLVRPAHLLMPGLVHARACFDPRAYDPAPSGPLLGAGEATLLGIAQLLRSGVTTFAHVGGEPRSVAQVALEQGVRLCLGLPVPAAAGGTPGGAGLSAALELHDAYRGHPGIVTRFALPDTSTLEDAFLARLATVSVEIDAGVLAPVHATRHEIVVSLRRHGERPLARLDRHGLLSPAFAAAHLTHLTAQDLELAQRHDIAVTLCPQAAALGGEGEPPLATLAAAGLRLSLGRDGALGARHPALWGDLEWLVLHAPALFTPQRALAIATREAARALALEELGTLAPGCWADLACFACEGPEALAGSDPLETLLLGGARGVANDVWVAGRQLICEGAFTRLDWPRLAARLRAARPQATAAAAAAADGGPP